MISAKVLSESKVLSERIIISANNRNVAIIGDSKNNLYAYNFHNHTVNKDKTFHFSSRYSLSAITSHGNYIAVAFWF